MRRLPAALLVSGRALGCPRTQKAALKRTHSKRSATPAPADADQALLELWAGQVLKGTLYVSRASPDTLTSAALVAALGAETDFTLRAMALLALSLSRRLPFPGQRSDCCVGTACSPAFGVAGERPFR